MTNSVDRTKCLDELDPPPWGPPTFDSGLVTACHRLRTKPIGEFSVEDLRIMIGQNIGLDYLVPLAIEELERNPLAEGDFYPGDLLKSVLSSDRKFWPEGWGLRNRLVAVLERITEADADLREAIAVFLQGMG